MRARDLAEPCVSLSKDADAIEAVPLAVERCLPGSLVTDSSGQPYAALPACDVVRPLVPGYVREDRGLAAVIDESHADHLCRTLQGRVVADCLPVGRPFLPTAAPDWAAVQFAELTARTGNPLIAVVDPPARERPACPARSRPPASCSVC
jgi:hypothetical protein